MLEWIQAIGIVVGCVVGVASILGGAGGVVWWASQIWSEVTGIRREIVEMTALMREQHDALWQRVNHHTEELHGHDLRITRLE